MDMAESPEQDNKYSRSTVLVGGLVLLGVPTVVTVIFYLLGSPLWFAWAVGFILLYYFVAGPILADRYRFGDW